MDTYIDGFLSLTVRAQTAVEHCPSLLAVMKYHDRASHLAVSSASLLTMPAKNAEFHYIININADLKKLPCSQGLTGLISAQEAKDVGFKV